MSSYARDIVTFLFILIYNHFIIFCDAIFIDLNYNPTSCPLKTSLKVPEKTFLKIPEINQIVAQKGSPVAIYRLPQKAAS
jgi:hypothetical protein